MIDRDGLYERGILSAGIGWQVPRIPGLGEVDWRVLFSELYRGGYDGHIIIEHEDRVFEGTRRARQARFPRRPRHPAAVHQVRSRDRTDPRRIARAPIRVSDAGGPSAHRR